MASNNMSGEKIIMTHNSQRFFEVVSDLFHPISNAGIAFFLLTMFAGSNDIVMKTIYFVIALSFSVIIPFLYIFSLKRKGHLETVDIMERMQRLNPFAFSIFSYFAGFIVLRLVDAPLHVQGLMFCYGSNTLLVMPVTRCRKVSAHTTGMIYAAETTWKVSAKKRQGAVSARFQNNIK
ncbi:MAG: hypothetical protein OQK59_08460 [Chlorobium sp.]|nr:hypothetical protein [Chlorobium sp.]